MNEQDQRIAIAEACGWKRTDYQSASLQVRADVPFWTDGKQFCQAEHLPEYLNDLDAMHEAEKVSHDQIFFMITLRNIVTGRTDDDQDIDFSEAERVLHATAAQRAEAFLRTIGKWVES